MKRSIIQCECCCLKKKRREKLDGWTQMSSLPFLTWFISLVTYTFWSWGRRHIRHTSDEKEMISKLCVLSIHQSLCIQDSSRDLFIFVKSTKNSLFFHFWRWNNFLRLLIPTTTKFIEQDNQKKNKIKEIFKLRYRANSSPNF